MVKTIYEPGDPEIRVESVAGQHVVVNPRVDGVKILSAKVSGAKGQARVITEGTFTLPEPPPDPEPEPEPEPPPVPNGIVVPAGTGLRAAIAAAPPSANLILRGGDHLVSSSEAELHKKLSLWAYEGEKPRVHAGSARPNLLYVGSGGEVDIHGIEFATIQRALYDDSNGSALIEPRAGGIVDLFGCTLTFAPNSVSERQHQLYVADSPGRATATGCHFFGGQNKGTGVHCYHAPGGPVKIAGCDFHDYGFDTTNGIAVILDQAGLVAEIIGNTFYDCRYAAIQHRASASSLVKDNVGYRTTRGLQKSSTVGLTDINNVWN